MPASSRSHLFHCSDLGNDNSFLTKKKSHNSGTWQLCKNLSMVSKKKKKTMMMMKVQVGGEGRDGKGRA